MESGVTLELEELQRRTNSFQPLLSSSIQIHMVVHELFRRRRRTKLLVGGKVILVQRKSKNPMNLVPEKKFACKVRDKRKMSHDLLCDAVREIEILKVLKSCPYVISLEDVFENEDYIHVVLEYCEGDQLLERIDEENPMNERDAAFVFLQLMKALEHCSLMGVMHRDINPDNILFLKPNSMEIKVIDFEFANSYEPGEVFIRVNHSMWWNYVAPEVIKCKSENSTDESSLLHLQYGPEADIWSAGFILYSLLTGSIPFHGRSDRVICESLMKGDIDLSSRNWSSISVDAKKLIEMILVYDPKNRPSISDILNNQWLQNCVKEFDWLACSDTAEKKLEKRTFRPKEIFSMKIGDKNYSEEKIKTLERTLKSFATKYDDEITFDEIKLGYDAISVFYNTASYLDVIMLIKEADVYGNQRLNYKEFINNFSYFSRKQEKELVFSAFEVIDYENQGYISLREAVKIFIDAGIGDTETINSKFSEVVTDMNNEVSCEQFGEITRMLLSFQKQR